jgi:hypothetical protein
MIAGMSVHAKHPQYGSFHAVIVSEPAMDRDGNWFVCLSKEGKIIPIDVCYLENLT